VDALFELEGSEEYGLECLANIVLQNDLQQATARKVAKKEGEKGWKKTREVALADKMMMNVVQSETVVAKETLKASKDDGKSKGLKSKGANEEKSKGDSKEKSKGGGIVVETGSKDVKKSKSKGKPNSTDAKSPKMVGAQKGAKKTEQSIEQNVAKVEEAGKSEKAGKGGKGSPINLTYPADPTDSTNPSNPFNPFKPTNPQNPTNSTNPITLRRCYGCRGGGCQRGEQVAVPAMHVFERRFQVAY
jgi:hypothetical protein